jgi:hypothetical protein
MDNGIEIKIPKDSSKIDVNNLGEFIWWSAHLGTGFETLISAIEKVGNNSVAVRKYLFTQATLKSQ